MDFFSEEKGSWLFFFLLDKKMGFAFEKAKIFFYLKMPKLLEIETFFAFHKNAIMREWWKNIREKKNNQSKINWQLTLRVSSINGRSFDAAEVISVLIEKDLL
jgi:hypothetical protein